MNVSIVSPFRQDGAEKVKDYFRRVYDLDQRDSYQFLLTEGDSTDDTLDTLMSFAMVDYRIQVFKCDVFKPRYGPIINPERLEILAKVYNTGLDAVDLAWSDYVLFLPSDVLYQPDLVSRLILCDKDIVAPFFLLKEDYGQGEYTRFYDLWGFTNWDGTDFLPNRLEWYNENYPTVPFQVRTVGGTILFKSKVIEAGVRYTVEEADRGMCHMARGMGFEIWADPTTRVYHPHP